jgi:hypothetical protein
MKLRVARRLPFGCKLAKIGDLGGAGGLPAGPMEKEKASSLLRLSAFAGWLTDPMLFRVASVLANFRSSFERCHSFKNFPASFVD